MSMASNVSGEGQIMEKTDPDGDVLMMTDPFAEKNEVSNDCEVLSASIDWSGDVVVCQFTVKGEAVATSSDDSTNIYYFNIDLTTETDEEEIFFIYTSTGLSGGSLETGAIALSSDDFSSESGTFTFEFDKTHFGSYTEVLDIEVRATNTNGWMDEIRWDEGLPGDDDIIDDDTVDDDEEPQIPDPKTETPTDDSISVDIKTASFEYEVTEEHMTVEIKITGTTSGDVHHCSNVMITYDENGDPEDLEDAEWEVGPDVTERMTFLGYTIEQYFGGKGDGGEDDWSKWEFYVYMDGPFDENMTLFDTDDMEDKTAVFYLRAYSDESETGWNQASRDMTDEIKDDDEKDSPGLSLILVLASVAAAAIIIGYGRRRD
ncbi:MAG: hypothetical protein JW939_00970 [Candidatus Thermoplasmatota archaeon]|nr:hypothetical protein [Candidatus Thermoplasmatota archaeon]